MRTANCDMSSPNCAHRSRSWVLPSLPPAGPGAGRRPRGGQRCRPGRCRQCHGKVTQWPPRDQSDRGLCEWRKGALPELLDGGPLRAQVGQSPRPVLEQGRLLGRCQYQYWRGFDGAALSQRLSRAAPPQILSRLFFLAVATARHAHQTARRRVRLAGLESGPVGPSGRPHADTGLPLHEFDALRITADAANFAGRVQPGARNCGSIVEGLSERSTDGNELEKIV